jgi:hypothetical protein
MHFILMTLALMLNIFMSLGRKNIRQTLHPAITFYVSGDTRTLGDIKAAAFL